MKSFLLDSDVIIDVLAQRPEFVEISQQVLFLAEEKKFQAFTAAHSWTNIYYLIARINGKSNAISFLQKLSTFVAVAAEKQDEINWALFANWPDFEDAVLYASAVSKGNISGIVTRNTKDFKKSTIPVFDPNEFISSEIWR